MSLSDVTLLRVWIAVALLLSLVAAKATSMRAARVTRDEVPGFIWSPLLSVASWRQRTPLNGLLLRTKAARFALFAVLVPVTWWLYLAVLVPLGPSLLLRGYAAIIPLYFLVELFSTSLELAFSLSGWSIPQHMRNPLAARSIDELWGRRWGTWVSSWLRQVVFARYRRQPTRGTLAVFLFSGVWHEVLVDVPLGIFYRIDVMGGWSAYFAIQACGVLAERTFLRGHRRARFVFAWAVLLLPAPLALNAATLSAIGLLT